MAKKQQRSSKRPKGDPKVDGLARIAKAIERIAVCVERREERRDLVDAVSRMSLKQAAEEVGIKMKNGTNGSRGTRVHIAPTVVGRAHAKIVRQQQAEYHEDEG